MTERLENTSAVLGEYMLKGWTLTDQSCTRCRATPLMREPAREAEREGRSPIQFCASCDGGPDGRAQSETSSVYDTPLSQSGTDDEYDASISPTPSTIHAPSMPSTPPRNRARLLNPALSLRPASPSSPANSHAAAARGDPDAAADAISSLLLRGYSLLSATCPEPSCSGIPLVGFPRKKDGTRDPRRECVSCGKRWIDEKDLTASGLRPGSSSGSAASGPSSPRPRRGDETPRTKARRELYAQGEAIMAARALAKEQADTMPITATDLQDVKDEEAPLVASSSAVPPIPGSGRRHRPPFVADDHRPSRPDGKLRVVVVSTGSVASIKIPNIVAALGTDSNVEVQVVSTNSSLYFFDRDAVEKNKGVDVWTDADEWSDWGKIGDPILHIELRRWADLVVVAPCSADMLAKIAAGICDNLPLSMLRALEVDTPVILCPAMNTHMYAHPLTERHLSFIKEVLGYQILGPQGAGMLACGDVGAGKMTDWTDIVSIIRGFAAIRKTRKDVDDKTLLSTLMGDEEAKKVKEEKSDVFFTPRQETSSLPLTTLKGLPAPVHMLSAPIEAATYALELVEAIVEPIFAAVIVFLTSLVRALVSPLRFLRFLLSPLLFFLHLAFIVSSVVLRVFQAQPGQPPDLTKPAPHHLAMILVPGDGTRTDVERYIESVRRAVLWAAEWGVTTLTLWDTEGLGVRYHAAVTASLLDLPPSPPSSAGPPTPAAESDQTRTDDAITASVYVNGLDGPRRLEVHFLAPSAGDTVARVTQRLARDGTDPEAVTQAALDDAIKHDLHISSDPDLVIIHYLSPPGFVRGLLPRPAPELHGFPAWLLRITEIYTHPPRLPLYLPFLGSLLHASPLPIFRKIGAAFPSSVDVGVLDSDEWEGAQLAWEAVEQRRGA